MFSLQKTKHHTSSSSLCKVTALFLLLLISLLLTLYNSPSSFDVITESVEKFKITPISVKQNAQTEENNSANIPVTKDDPCSGRYVYMHDIPPKFNKALVTTCRKLDKWFDFCPYLTNDGFGPQINESSQDSNILTSSRSWYETNQFMLSVIFHNRMKKYECLTKNSSLASAVYVPFYAGLEVGQHLYDSYNLTLRDAAAVEFMTWVSNQPEWGRVFGLDHFFVAGRVVWDLRRLSNSNSSWGSKLLNLPQAKNMTMLTIESSPFDNNVFAIPYPTYFHPSKDIEVFEWQERVRKSKRRYLFSFGGAPRPKNKGSIREELINQCKNSSRGNCNLVNCKPNNDDMCNSPAHFIRMFLDSEFCLQPPGDTSTRRSTFYSILAGSIPVFFRSESAYSQYLWHFPKNYTKYSVFIPEVGIKNGTVSVEDILLKISQDEKSKLKEEVIGLIPRILYAQNKLDTLEDAFDLAVKRVLERINFNTERVRDG